jgi:methionine-rich copper-binding protein CopC
MKTKSRQSKQSRQDRQDRQDRQANLMIAVAVIAGIYFVVWTLIGMVL